MKFRYALYFAVAAIAAVPAAATELVTNGGFETGSLSDWSSNPNLSWGVTVSTPTDGAYSAFTGCVGAQCTD